MARLKAASMLFWTTSEKSGDRDATRTIFSMAEVGAACERVVSGRSGSIYPVGVRIGGYDANQRVTGFHSSSLLPRPRYQRRRSQNAALTSAISTGTSTSVPTTVAKATDEPMPNTAIAMASSGIALWLHNLAHHRPAIVFAAFSGLIGLATFAEHLFRIDLGIDQLVLNADWGQHATIVPGRMGPPASFMFILLNVALALTVLGNQARQAASLAATAAPRARGASLAAAHRSGTGSLRWRWSTAKELLPS